MIDRAIIDHAEVPVEERKLALKPPTPGVELSKGQARQLLRTIGSDLESHARSGLRAAANIATFIDGHGAEAIDEGWRGCPEAYLGGMIGMDPHSIRRLYRQGCALKYLIGRSGPNGPSSPGQLTSMYRMIHEKRADEIPKAWAVADEIRSHDVISWDGKKKKPPKLVTAKHVCAAVNKMLGKRPVDKEPPPPPPPPLPTFHDIVGRWSTTMMGWRNIVEKISPEDLALFAKQHPRRLWFLVHTIDGLKEVLPTLPTRFVEPPNTNQPTSPTKSSEPKHVDNLAVPVH